MDGRRMQYKEILKITNLEITIFDKEFKIKVPIMIDYENHKIFSGEIEKKDGILVLIEEKNSEGLNLKKTIDFSLLEKQVINGYKIGISKKDLIKKFGEISEDIINKFKKSYS